MIENMDSIRRDAARYRAIRGSKHLSWGMYHSATGGEAITASLPLPGDPIWREENEFDFEANLDAAADALVEKAKASGR